MNERETTVGTDDGQMTAGLPGLDERSMVPV
jgi:hypothetical protein